MCHVARRDIELRAAVETHENLTRAAADLVRILRGHIRVFDAESDRILVFRDYLHDALAAAREDMSDWTERVRAWFDTLKSDSAEFAESLARSQTDIAATQRARADEHAAHMDGLHEVNRFQEELARALLTSNSS